MNATKYQLRDAVIEMLTLRERGHGPAGWDERAQAALKAHDAEHAALVAVAEAAKGHQVVGSTFAQRKALGDALAALAAVRAGSEVAK
jgi:phage terminase large subunit-like protein